MRLSENSNFDWREFVHPSLWNSLGFPRVRWFVSPFMVNYAELLREVLDAPVIINNWHTGGKYVGRGYRPPNYRPTGGALFSQHYLGKALDVSSTEKTPEQIVQAIHDHKGRFLAVGLTTLEHLADTPGWVHGDCRERIPGIHPENDFLVVRA